MSHINITADARGFNIVGGAGQLMAPDTFFAGGLMASGLMISLDPTLGWTWGDNLRHSNFGMHIIADVPPSEALELGASWAVTVTAVSYWRMLGDEQVEIGRMVLPEPLLVDAYWQTVGADDTPAWVADLGHALGHMLSSSGVRFIGGAGDDVFSAISDAIYMRGHSILMGGAGDDRLTGGVGNDTLRGGIGNDWLSDASGQNLLVGGAGNDTITLGAQSNASVARGGAGDDVMRSSVGNDTLMGNSGHDRLFGGAGDDILLGGNGRDYLDGGTGDDVLNGGRSNDILIGDGGADTFVFNSAERGRDIIRDFEDGQDLIEITGLVGGMADLTIVQNGANAEIYWGGQLHITLDNAEAYNLTSDDFTFI